MESDKIQPIKPLPYSYYFYSVVIIALSGFCDSVYLSISHYRVYTDLGYQSFCAVSQAINCDTVSQSPYSIFLGVPVPVWGMVGYASFLFLLFYARSAPEKSRRIWSLLFLIAFAFSVYSMILAAVSTFFIHSYCIMCILSYAVNLLLIYFTWLIRKRFRGEPLLQGVGLDVRYLISRRKSFLPVMCSLCVGVAVMMLFFPAYWLMRPPVLSKDIPTGVTEEGFPWIGAEDPELVIVEFTDYRCFQCKKMHFFLRRIIQEQPGKIRLVHRHFPMDPTINPIVHQPLHSGAAKLAMLAIIAEENQKFWEMNDLLFGIKRKTEAVNMDYFAQQTEIPLETVKAAFRNPKMWMKLRKDIEDGIKIGLSGTPGYLINGQVYLGLIPAELLRKYF
ncbi:vitamin K epoxide reductase family protein [uncultured Desulfosarcina sp.]|uniref:vitamin K epoxide reductase/DsbA family protein n=1 Tax=uncultured Desulfosarcina sp. TaxID=218289 RepID=UPI0029C75DA6|nr:vitamin K epoxide reductase family protein [uncultured Desulfosarcina sp.]